MFPLQFRSTTVNASFSYIHVPLLLPLPPPPPPVMPHPQPTPTLSSCYCYCFFSSAAKAAKAVAAAAPTTTTTRYPCATINQVTLCCVVPYGRHIPVYTSMACLWCQLVSFLSATMNERVGEARVISITIRSKSSVGMAINKFNEISVF